MIIPGSKRSSAEVNSEIYEDLLKFTYFNGGHNNYATVRIEGNIAYFDALGWFFGGGSDWINDPEVGVALSEGPGGHEVSGQTLGNHQLVGVRRWRVDVSPIQGPTGDNPDLRITIETEAYERRRNDANTFGSQLAGEAAQLGIWDAYLQNLSDEYQRRYRATDAKLTHSTEFLGLIKNPWGPDDQYVPRDDFWGPQKITPLDMPYHLLR